MKSKLSIQRLQLKTTIGAYPWEQHIEQVVLMDLELWLDITQAVATDNLTDALDYANLAIFLQDSVKKAHFQLLEKLAVFLQQQLIEHYPQIHAGKIVVEKPGALTNAHNVSITIEWP